MNTYLLTFLRTCLLTLGLENKLYNYDQKNATSMTSPFPDRSSEDVWCDK